MNNHLQLWVPTSHHKKIIKYTILDTTSDSEADPVIKTQRETAIHRGDLL